MMLWEPRVLWNLYEVVGALSAVDPLRCCGSLECCETSMMLLEPRV